MIFEKPENKFMAPQCGHTAVAKVSARSISSSTFRRSDSGTVRWTKQALVAFDHRGGAAALDVEAATATRITEV